MRLINGILPALALAGLFAAPAASAGEQQSVAVLFVASAERMVSDGTTVTFSGSAPNVVWFTDRPERKAGLMPMDRFLDRWASGLAGFAGDPPNAVLTIGGQIEHPVIVELTDPVQDGDAVTYGVAVLHGTLPEVAGPVSIVFDDDDCPPDEDEEECEDF